MLFERTWQASGRAACLLGVSGQGKGASVSSAGYLRAGLGVVLRRQSANITDGRPGGGYGDVFEIICRDCGDDPGLDYRAVSPRLRLVRGPYPLAVGVAAYEQHIEWHQPAAGQASARPAQPAPGHR